MIEYNDGMYWFNLRFLKHVKMMAKIIAEGATAPEIVGEDVINVDEFKPYGLNTSTWF